MFRSAPRQSVPQNVLFSSSQTYTQGCGLLKFFLVIFWTSLSSRKFSAYSSLQYSPSQKSHGRKHSSVLLPSVTFWHHEVSSSYHHYIRNTLVKRKLSSVLPQSIMFCPLICTSLTMFSPHVTISNPMNGDFFSPPSSSYVLRLSPDLTPSRKFYFNPCLPQRYSKKS